MSVDPGSIVLAKRNESVVFIFVLVLVGLVTSEQIFAEIEPISTVALVPFDVADAYRCRQQNDDDHGTNDRRHDGERIVVVSLLRWIHLFFAVKLLFRHFLNKFEDRRFCGEISALVGIQHFPIEDGSVGEVGQQLQV